MLTSQETKLWTHKPKRQPEETPARSCNCPRFSKAKEDRFRSPTTNQRYLKLSIIADFATTERGRRLHSIDPSMPFGKFAALINSLPRRHASALCQLITGHVLLNNHLTRIGKIDSPTCPKCGANTETVRHFVLVCPAHWQARLTLERKVGRQRMKLEHLLTSAKSLPHFFRFLNSTERLRQTFGNIIPPTSQVHPERTTI